MGACRGRVRGGARRGCDRDAGDRTRGVRSADGRRARGNGPVAGGGEPRLLVFLGRTHLYEGLPVAATVHGVRTAVMAGCRVVALTNAAGGIRDGLPRRAAGDRAGPPQPDRAIPADWAAATGAPPVAFADLTDLYSRRLRRLPADADPSLADGVYAAMPGPHDRDPSGDRHARTLGPTWSACRPCWRRSPPATWAPRSSLSRWSPTSPAGLSGAPLSHQEVIAAAGQRLRDGRPPRRDPPRAIASHQRGTATAPQAAPSAASLA